MGKVILLPSKLNPALAAFLLLLQVWGELVQLLKYRQICHHTCSQVFALFLARMCGFALISSGFYFPVKL